MLLFFALWPNDKSLNEQRLRAIKAGQYLQALAWYTTAGVFKAAGVAATECEFTPTIAKMIEVLKRDTPPPSAPRFKAREPVSQAYIDWRRRNHATRFAPLPPPKEGEVEEGTGSFGGIAQRLVAEIAARREQETEAA